MPQTNIPLFNLPGILKVIAWCLFIIVAIGALVFMYKNWPQPNPEQIKADEIARQIALDASQKRNLEYQEAQVKLEAERVQIAKERATIPATKSDVDEKSMSVGEYVGTRLIMNALGF